MFKKNNGNIDWFKLITVIAACAIIVTSIIIPVVNFIKKQPSNGTEEAGKTASAFLKSIL